MRMLSINACRVGPARVQLLAPAFAQGALALHAHVCSPGGHPHLLWHAAAACVRAVVVCCSVHLPATTAFLRAFLGWFAVHAHILRQPAEVMRVCCYQQPSATQERQPAFVLLCRLMAGRSSQQRPLLFKLGARRMCENKAHAVIASVCVWVCLWCAPSLPAALMLAVFAERQTANCKSHCSCYVPHH